MSLSQFPAAMSRLSATVLAAAAAIRDVQGGTGPLPLAQLDRIQFALRNAKLASYAAISEGNKAPVPAERLMADMGGPADLATFQALVQDIEVKAAAWHAALDDHLASLTGADLLRVAEVVVDGVAAKVIERTNTMPATSGDALRADPSLSELLTAFEAVGA
ncbi:hypothetical protein [Limimaricola pyoseonensis]|uniref:Uncharacterized protein n=1 Tax=Limimaricola pyoseonensis TaxID=521013 RepID=A0A1G7GP00_9RHOB|nr:hypothetical protein [Limimaricola pyoseonensis]SDE89719.1 hypothetical protein SAMN04488567_2859 [Limimaricola pyoseonensis]